jgi:Penicillin-insensitive murein endopeptidase
MPRRPARRTVLAPVVVAAGALLALLALVATSPAGAPGAGSSDPSRPPGAATPTAPAPPAGPPPARFEPVRWRRSRALGLPWRGRLVRGVQLPAEGADLFSWDPVLERAPGRAWRRWGSDRLVLIVLRVLREHRAAIPGAPRVAVGDLSRPRGGDFGPRFGALGHASHQNGLDVDVYYPRLDRRELAPRHPRQVDRALAQDLVDRFVAAGATYVFVGPSLGLGGPRRIVRPLVHHDDHLHVRIRAPRRPR